MSRSPAFQFYPADYLADANVDMMTLEQQGAYVRLLCHSWRSTTVGRLLNDPIQLSRLARMTPEQWSANSAAILRAFRIDEDGYITQKRLVEEWEKQEAHRNQCIAAGKNSAKKRWGKSERPLNDRSTTVQREGNSSSSYSIVRTQEGLEVGKDTPVELPPGFPRSEQEAVVWAHSAGVPEQFIRDCWVEALGRGGNDERGNKITVWVGYVKGRHNRFVNYKEEKKANENSKRGGSGSVDRNKGTANEGKASQYRGVGKVV